jgi:alkylhydroperoxidase/carboxymuconolactone decarboxylase family protein YurZ
MKITEPVNAARPARATQEGERQLESRTGSRCASSIPRGPRRRSPWRIAPAVAGVLDAKTIELIGIALDASCTHMYAPGVRRHIQRALKAGATKREITAVLQLACMQGFTACASPRRSCSRNSKHAQRRPDRPLHLNRKR